MDVWGPHKVIFLKTGIAFRERMWITEENADKTENRKEQTSIFYLEDGVSRSCRTVQAT